METKVFKMEELQEIATSMLRDVVAILDEENINYTMFFGSMLGSVRHHGPIPWDYDIDIGIHENDMERFIELMETRLPDKYWVDFRSKYDTPKLVPRIGIRGFDTYWLHIDVYRLVGFPDSHKKNIRICKMARLLLEMRLVKNVNIEYYTGEKRKKILLYRKILKPVSTNFIVKRFDKLCKKYPYETANKVGIAYGRRGVDDVFDKSVIEDTILVDYADFKVRIPRAYDDILTMLYGDYMKYPPQEEIDSLMNKDYILTKIDM